MAMQSEFLDRFEQQLRAHFTHKKADEPDSTAESGKQVPQEKAHLDSLYALALPELKTPSKLQSALEHALFSGGKRLRPLLLWASSQLFVSDQDPLPAALALECMHSYSLVHDDLPAMDNSELRRGKPSCHIAFDEATAILVGDALQAEAFKILCTHYEHSPEKALALIETLSKAVDKAHLVGGQVEDLRMQQEPIKTWTSARYTAMVAAKTAALIQAALKMGLILGKKVPQELFEQMNRMGYHLGIVFQIQDDLMDAANDAPEMDSSPKAPEQAQSKRSHSLQLLLDKHLHELYKIVEDIGIAKKSPLYQIIEKIQNRLPSGA